MAGNKITKYDLLNLFKNTFNKEIEIIPESGTITTLRLTGEKI